MKITNNSVRFTAFIAIGLIKIMMSGGVLLAATATPPVIAINRIVAIVNDEVITQQQVNKQMPLIKKQLTTEGITLPNNAVLEKQIINQLVNQKLQLQLASQRHITASSQEVSATLQRLATSQKKTTAQIYQQAAHDGLDRQAVRQQIKNNIIIQKLEQQAMFSRINISDQAVDNFLQQMQNNPKYQAEYQIKDILIGLPPNPSTQQITATKDRADVLVQQLHSGADFNKLALAQSDSQSTLANGGNLGWRKLAELPNLFTNAVTRMKAGDIAGPLRGANGFHIIKLVAIRGIPKQHTTPQVDLEQIVLKSKLHRTPKKTAELAQQLYNDIKQGQSFSTLAKKYSEGEHASSGGYVGWVSLNSYPQSFAQVIRALNAGDISVPTELNGDLYIVRVIGKRQGVVLSQDQRNQAKQLLYQSKVMENLQAWLNQIRSQAYVRIISAKESR